MTIKHPRLSMDAGEKMTSYKQQLLETISTQEITPDSLIEAWELWQLYEDNRVISAGNDPKIVNSMLHKLVESIKNRTKVDPEIVFLGGASFLEAHMDENSLLLNRFRDAKQESAEQFCDNMMIIAIDPTKLLAM